jgi:hypothetical protein
MSKYSENTTQFKDTDCLVQALIDMGFDKSEIELHEKGDYLKDYHGRRTKYLNGSDYDTAEIIIRQGAVNRRLSSGASNDLGFKKNANGTYSAIISAYDSSFVNAEWMGKLKTNYAENGIKKQAKRVGLRYVSTTSVNGKRQVIFAKA